MLLLTAEHFYSCLETNLEHTDQTRRDTIRGHASATSSSWGTTKSAVSRPKTQDYSSCTPASGAKEHISEAAAAAAREREKSALWTTKRLAAAAAAAAAEDER
jgi:hypothetical protein